jgi:hypothetical protein
MEVDYVGLTKLANRHVVDTLNTLETTKEYTYEYEFRFMEETYYKTEDIHPSTGKINVIKKIIEENLAKKANPIESETPYEVLVFLDSDAWIQNPDYLHFLIKKMVLNKDKHGSFSRDPYLVINSYINSGSFILKLNNYTEQMFSNIKKHMIEEPAYHNKWMYDQYYISDYIFQHKEDFYIFVPNMLNTPYGHILRHNWWKSQKLFGDLYALLDVHRNPSQNYHSPMRLDYDAYLDNHVFPNIDDNCDQYLT